MVRGGHGQSIAWPRIEGQGEAREEEGEEGGGGVTSVRGTEERSPCLAAHPTSKKARAAPRADDRSGSAGPSSPARPRPAGKTPQAMLGPCPPRTI
jgi:hypothetical protein